MHKHPGGLSIHQEGSQLIQMFLAGVKLTQPLGASMQRQLTLKTCVSSEKKQFPEPSELAVSVEDPAEGIH